MEKTDRANTVITERPHRSESEITIVRPDKVSSYSCCIPYITGSIDSLEKGSSCGDVVGEKINFTGVLIPLDAGERDLYVPEGNTPLVSCFADRISIVQCGSDDSGNQAK